MYCSRCTLYSRVQVVLNILYTVLTEATKDLPVMLYIDNICINIVGEVWGSQAVKVNKQLIDTHRAFKLIQNNFISIELSEHYQKHIKGDYPIKIRRFSQESVTCQIFVI